MAAKTVGTRFLTRLRVAGQQFEDPTVERVLAPSRLFLALTSLSAWYLQAPIPAPFSNIAFWLLVGYSAHAMLLVVLLPSKQAKRGYVLWCHLSDILWPSAVCLFTDSPNSFFFVLFLFAMIGSAFRWGFSETMATAEISVAVLLVEALGVTYGPAPLRKLLYTQLSMSRVVMRCGFLVLSGFLLGFLAETEKELRAEIALSNSLLSFARTGARLNEVVQAVFVSLSRVFGSPQIYDVVWQPSSGRAYRWELSSATPAQVRVADLPPHDHAAAVMAEYPHAFCIWHTPVGAPRHAALDQEGQRIEWARHDPTSLPVSDSVLAVSHEFGGDWCGRLVVLNPQFGRRHERELRFAQNIVRQLAPAIYSVYLFRRLRSQAGATERARVARELHDTAIQSLISIEMQVDVLRRRNGTKPEISSDLQRIQELLRQEILNLRELIQTMRPVDIGPKQFLDFVAQLVERFSRDTGVEARFLSELQEVTMPAATCRELARVVQEGLVNIRKHSGARSALVRFATQNGSWKLVIDDDGRGFPFTGRYTLNELDGSRHGPAVIKERVRAVGGDMVIESTPGRGARLEITVPQKGRAAHG